jgi:trk system potassium uptake protein TrkA
MQANVLTVVQLKELGVPYVVAKARNLLHGKLLEKIGADSIVYPERDMAKRVAYSLTSRNIMDYIELSPDYSIAEVGVPKSIAGKSLIESNVRAKYGLNVVAIKRNDKLILPPNPHDVIEKDDIIVVVGSNEGMKRWEDLK